MAYLWRAVDAEGEVLDVLVQSKRNKHAALKLMRKLLRKYAVAPERLVTDDLRSYRAARKQDALVQEESDCSYRASGALKSIEDQTKRPLHLDVGVEVEASIGR